MTNIFFIDLYAYFFFDFPPEKQLHNPLLGHYPPVEKRWSTATWVARRKPLLKHSRAKGGAEIFGLWAEHFCLPHFSLFICTEKKKHLRRFIRENTLAFVEKVRRSRATSTLAGHRRAFTSQSSLFSSPERLWGFDPPVEHVCDLVFSSLDFSLSGVRNPQPACWWKCTSRPVHRRRTAVHSDSFHRRFPSQFQRTLRYRGKKKTGNSLLSVSDVRFAWVFPLERWAQGRWMLLIGFNPLMWKCSLEQAHLHLAPSEVADSLQ